MLSVIVYTLSQTFGVVELLCTNLHPSDGCRGWHGSVTGREGGRGRVGLTIKEKHYITAVSHQELHISTTVTHTHTHTQPNAQDQREIIGG